jgi:hypothetical protein
MKTVPLAGGLLVLGLGVLGCDAPRGDVSGRVTFKGQPVVYGSVTFMGKDNLLVLGQIQPDGRYTVAGVLAGDNQVAVNSPDPDPPDRPLKPGQDSRPPIDRQQWFAIPDHYGDPRKSGLSCKVQKGLNTFDIPLE